MIEELQVASNLLKYALENYANVCRSILSRHVPGSPLAHASKLLIGEIQTMTLYESQLSQGKQLLEQLRTHCTSIAPINTLPPEILARIFLRVADGDECALEPSWGWLPHDRAKPKIKPPLSLGHVCSYWRSVALASHILWTHVDLAPFTTYEKTAIERARFFSSHAGALPLTFHIVMGPNTDSPHKRAILELCVAVAKRTKYINLRCKSKFVGSQVSVAGKIFASCIPGRLNRLVIKLQHAFDTHGFLTAQDWDEHPNHSWTLDVSHSHFEKVLRHVTNLRSEGIYPYWTSQAYAGLMRLQLMDLQGRGVTISGLARVLDACPQLRSFCFGFSLARSNDDEPAPVHLKYLEFLYLEFDNFEDRGKVLRLILPGSKPFRMFTRVREGRAPTRGEHKLFFERSNVVELSTSVPPDSCYISLPSLLEVMPSVEKLFLEGSDLVQGSGRVPILNQVTRAPRLTQLHLSGLNFQIDAFAEIVQRYSLARVTVDPKSCMIMDKDHELHFLEPYRDILKEICPILEFIPWEDPSEREWFGVEY